MDTAHRGKGIARAFYERLIALARKQYVPLVCAEIETEPVHNGPSLRLHVPFGFQGVGIKPYGEGVTVSFVADPFPRRSVDGNRFQVAFEPMPLYLLYGAATMADAPQVN